MLAAPMARLGIFEAFLSALRDAQSGARLHALLAPGAIVRGDAGLVAASDITPGDFARAFAGLVSQGAGLLPDYRDARPLQAGGAEDASHAVDWFEVSEARAGRTLLVGVGFELHSGETRIGWSRAAARMEPCSYRQGYARALGDYTWMNRSHPARARVLLDASYFRLFPSEQVRFDCLDDARFGCHMSATCCRIDFEIDVDPAAQRLIDAIPWADLGVETGDRRLPVRADGRLQLKSGGEPCRFLGPDNRCLVHQVLGMQPFATCAVYPYAFAHTPEGVAVAVSTVCPSARAARGPSPTQDISDLLERFLQANPRRTESYRLGPDRAVPWETFRDVEGALLACMALADAPLRRRLYLAARTLAAVRDNEPLTLQAWLAERMDSPLEAGLRAALGTMLAGILEWDRPTLRDLPRAVPSGLATMEFPQPDMLARTLRNMLKSKSYSYEFDLATALNLAIVLYLVALLMQAALPGPLSETHWQDLGALGMHGMLKQLLRDGVPEGFRTVAGTPEFGLWLLAL